MGDSRSEGTKSRINPTIYDDIMSSLGLTECKSVPSPVEFEQEDPLGVKMISSNSTFDLTMRVNKDKSCEQPRPHRRTLGEQAYVITSIHDRALALKRITVAAQISLSRDLVLNMVHLLSQCPENAALAHGLRSLCLGDTKILVSLMRLVAARRVCLSGTTF